MPVIPAATGVATKAPGFAAAKDQVKVKPEKLVEEGIICACCPEQSGLLETIKAAICGTGCMPMEMGACGYSQPFFKAVIITFTCCGWFVVLVKVRFMGAETPFCAAVPDTKKVLSLVQL